MSELGQMLFGNPIGEYDLGDNEGSVASELYDLSRELGNRAPEAQAHGLLGGEWGYGQDFKNDVFEMWPYWWGDCDCGFQEAEFGWDEANSHRADCWHERWSAEHDRIYALALDDYDESVRLMAVWEQANGWDGPGVAVYCDCGVAERWQKWRTTHDHKPECSEARPNFRCEEVEVRWYKYIGRGMTVNREVTRSEWRKMFARCAASLDPPAATSHVPQDVAPK